MITIPRHAKQVDIRGSHLDYLTFNHGQQEYIYFDASQEKAPIPILGAIRGLSTVKNKKTKLIMVHDHIPQALLDKLGESYEVQTESLTDGRTEIVFSYKGGANKKITFNDFYYKDIYRTKSA